VRAKVEFAAITAKDTVDIVEVKTPGEPGKIEVKSDCGFREIDMDGDIIQAVRDVRCDFFDSPPQAKIGENGRDHIFTGPLRKRFK